VAKLLDATEAGALYQLEYTVEKLGLEPRKHLMSVLGMAYNGT
jgi:hypothetical protein